MGDTKPVGMASLEDEDDGGFESISKVLQVIKTTFGEGNTHKVLASLYVVRTDTDMRVRQLSLQVWKSVVSNTPRTLVEIMPTLVDVVVSHLSSPVYDLCVMASRCLGEVVKKLGHKVLTLLVPCLKEGLQRGDVSTRQGICLGLSEILSALTRVQVETYIDSLIPSLQQALCDEDDGVRSQAANAFQTLSKCIGPRAIGEIVPVLVQQLGQKGVQSELALLGLREVVQLKPRDLLEFLLPRLLKSPMDAVSITALTTIVGVTGEYLHHHFPLIITSLVSELSLPVGQKSAEELDAIKLCASTVMGSAGSVGLNFLIIELGKQIENDNDSSKRKWGCWLTQQFVEKTNLDFSDYISVLLKYLLARVADSDREVLTALMGALMALSDHYPVEQYTEQMDFISSCISSAASDARFRTSTTTAGAFTQQASSSGQYILPLFTIPKSLDAFLPMLLFALTNGSPHSRETAATVLGELVQMCDTDVLKPSLIKITGPLIRVVKYCKLISNKRPYLIFS